MATILLVDDNHSFVWAMRRFLKGVGHEILDASNGVEALGCLDRVPVDLVITDLNMPGLDGVGTITELRRRNASVPIIAVSGEIPIQPNFSLHTAGERGADRVLQKPFRPDDLLKAVTDLLPVDGGEARREVSGPINATAMVA